MGSSAMSAKVTSGATGIGLGIARALIDAGMSVAIGAAIRSAASQSGTRTPSRLELAQSLLSSSIYLNCEDPNVRSAVNRS
jgi:NAD(P)-dependent dehydrogenase (short-subunit alcohol dehydrogenase family)